jgi:hypothetical protein
MKILANEGTKITGKADRERKIIYLKMDKNWQKHAVN